MIQSLIEVQQTPGSCFLCSRPRTCSGTSPSLSAGGKRGRYQSWCLAWGTVTILRTWCWWFWSLHATGGCWGPLGTLPPSTWVTWRAGGCATPTTAPTAGRTRLSCKWATGTTSRTSCCTSALLPRYVLAHKPWQAHWEALLSLRCH